MLKSVQIADLLGAQGYRQRRRVHKRWRDHCRVCISHRVRGQAEGHCRGAQGRERQKE